MNALPRSRVLVQVRIQSAERDRWIRAATLEHQRLGELVRFAVRSHVRELERLRLLAREPTPTRPSSAA
jgi:hypothetical protein